jgi:predicted DNA-binding transcriptional regulator YafY
VIGHDHDRGEQRTFRVDRFDRDEVDVGSPRLVRAAALVRSAVGVPGRPEADRHDAFDGVDGACASTRSERPRSSVNSAPTGSSTRPRRRHRRTVPASNLPAFRSWVLGLLEHAVVLDRRRPRTVIDWLSRSPGRRRRRERPAQRRGSPAAAAGDAAVADGGRRGTARRGGRRYGLTEAQVQQDLELVAMCGLPPFVDEMIDVFVDDGMVFVGVPRLFTRPLRLTAPEASRCSRRAGGDGAAGRRSGRGARTRSRQAGGRARRRRPRHRPTTPAGVVVDLARPPLTDELAEAAASEPSCASSYYTPARDEVAERTIVPRHVFVDAGNWYVLADDDRSGERRTFRIDRIESVDAHRRWSPPVDDAPPPERSSSTPRSPGRRCGSPRPRAGWSSSTRRRGVDVSRPTGGSRCGCRCRAIGGSRSC